MRTRVAAVAFIALVFCSLEPAQALVVETAGTSVNPATVPGWTREIQGGRT